MGRLEAAGSATACKTKERVIPTILSFLTDQLVFEPEETHAMSVAFEDACRALKLDDDARQAREAIAVRIIELVRRGERDPERLRERVLRTANEGESD